MHANAAHMSSYISGIPTGRCTALLDASRKISRTLPWSGPGYGRRAGTGIRDITIKRPLNLVLPSPPPVPNLESVSNALAFVSDVLDLLALVLLVCVRCRRLLPSLPTGRASPKPLINSCFLPITSSPQLLLRLDLAGTRHRFFILIFISGLWPAWLTKHFFISRYPNSSFSFVLNQHVDVAGRILSLLDRNRLGADTSYHRRSPTA